MPRRATRVVRADAAGVEAAAACLRDGGLVAFPTETVYGLGARADQAEAVRAIFAAKGRPANNPLIVHVADEAAAARLASAWSGAARALAAAFWPGPLTLVVPARSGAVAPEVTASSATVALRVPAHPIARALLELVALPIAAPSANRSEGISPTTADHVVKTLDGRIDLVLDGGPSACGIESSIVDVTREPAVLLRPGAIALDALSAAAPVTPGQHRRETAGGDAAIAPGGFARHYAPRARLVVVPDGTVSREVRTRRTSGARIGALIAGRSLAPPCETLPDDAVGFAAGLYAALHRLDDEGCDVIVAAEPPADPAWDAVRDRLRRASSS